MLVYLLVAFGNDVPMYQMLMFLCIIHFDRVNVFKTLANKTVWKIVFLYYTGNTVSMHTPSENIRTTSE